MTYHIRKATFGRKAWLVLDASGAAARPTYMTREEAEATAADLNAGTLEPDPTADDKLAQQVAEALVADLKGINERRGTMQRSMLGGGHDTQIWDES